MNTHYKSELANNDELFINEQQRLLEAIWNDDSTVIANCGFEAQGVHIYRKNLLASAIRALTINFPTLFELLDSDVREDVTFQFLKLSPPNQGDWAQWGKELADFIAKTEVGHKYPYLSDCTTLDWHVHCALDGVDQTFNSSSLQLLADNDPEHIFIKFNENVKLIKTKYPISEIFDAHHGDDEHQREVAMDKAKQALASTLEEHTVMIYRPEFQPKIIRLAAGEDIFMHCLIQGKSLGHSLSAANGNNHFSFETWLVKAIKQNLIYNFTEN